MNQFWQISGIVLWVLFIGYILLRVIYGKKWQLKAGANFFMGSGLMGAAKKVVEEVNQADIKKETLTELAVHVFWRLTKIGIFGILIAFIPFILLFQQNKLITKQNSKIDVQNNLIEAERRSSLVFLMSNLLDKMDDEIKEQRIEFDQLKIDRDSMRFRLSSSLIARTVALSRAFKPYRMLDGDILSDKVVSPERGQLFISLMESQLDSFTQSSIVRKGNFSNAIVGDIDIEYSNFSLANFMSTDFTSANFIGADLSFADFMSANLIEVDFVSANLSYADLRSANLTSAKLSSAKLNSANLQQAELHSAELHAADLRAANLQFANLQFCKLSSVDFRDASLRFANLRSANLTFADFASADLNSADFSFSDLKRVKNLTVKQLKNAHSLYESKNLPPEIEAQLRKEKPCLFTEEGCP